MNSLGKNLVNFTSLGSKYNMISEKSKVKVGFTQFSCVADKEANIKKTKKVVEDLAQKGAQIICMQELFQTLYFCDEEVESNFELADVLSESADLYGSIAKEFNVVIIASLFEKRAAGVYHNTAIVLDADGSYLGFYRKKHIPDDPGFYEKYYFTPGDDDYKVFKTKYANIGVLVCWDQWFPEAARITALKGADILFYPTAIGWELDSSEALKEEEYNAWKIMHQSHAIANGLHVVSVNRVGQEAGTKFWGGSLVLNPFGTPLVQTGLEEEEVVCEIDLSATERYRRRWPYLRDRRTDTYSGLQKRWLGDE